MAKTFTGDVDMKQNTEPMEVTFSKKIRDAIKKILCYKGTLKPPVEVIIESGTYLGKGTTKEIAEIIVEITEDIPIRRKEAPLVYTLEPKDWIYEQAKNNLKKYSFVQPIFGMSLNLYECLDFIANDEAILNHLDYPDLFIDCTKDPIYMYRTEIWSCFDGKEYKPMEGMFYQLIPQYRNQNPLIVLDSAGGIGLLEFQKVQELMEGHHYYLLIDDVGHLKHFRTAEHIRNNPDKWKIMADDGRCMLSEFKGI